MANSDGYNSPVDFRITRDPAPVSDKGANTNFDDLYDFAFAVIATFVKYCGVGTIDPGSWSTIRPQDSLFSGNLNKLYVKATANIAAGHMISLVLSGGVLQASPASAAAGSVAQADGYATAGVVSGAIGEFIIGNGLDTTFNGTPAPFTIGQRYWLNTAGGGGLRTTPAVAAGQLEQYIGIAVSTSAIMVNLGPAIQH